MTGCGNCHRGVRGCGHPTVDRGPPSQEPSNLPGFVSAQSGFWSAGVSKAHPKYNLAPVRLQVVVPYLPLTVKYLSLQDRHPALPEFGSTAMPYVFTGKLVHWSSVVAPVVVIVFP